MKWHILVLVSMTTGISGCTTSLTTGVYTGQYIGHIETGLIDYTMPVMLFDNGDQQPNFRDPHRTTIPSPNLSTTGNIHDKKLLSDILPQIIFQDDRLIYRDIFSLTFPKSLVEWEYMTGGLEMISFSDIDKHYYFYLVARTPSSSTQRLDDIKKCTDNPIGTTTALQKSLGNTIVYSTTTIYPESKIPLQGLCFLYDGWVYTLTLSKYNDVYTHQILDSFRFLKTPTPQQKATTKTPSDIQQSMLPHPLSSLYNDIILSGHTLLYSGLFSIELPTCLQFRKSKYLGTYSVDVYFTDKLFRLFQLDDVRYVHFTRQPIALVSSKNNQHICLTIQNDGSPNTSTIITGDNDTIVYNKNRSYDSFGYQRNQGDLCFVDDDFVSTISIRQYSISDVISTINSLHFY